jgi:hypothetical protein
MEAKRFDEFHKHGCNFSGKLVVVDYLADMEKDPRWGTYNAGLTFDYLAKAKQLVKDKGYDVVLELLSIPEYVVMVK